MEIINDEDGTLYIFDGTDGDVYAVNIIRTCGVRTGWIITGRGLGCPTFADVLRVMPPGYPDLVSLPRLPEGRWTVNSA
jgi:hypothetical protein